MRIIPRDDHNALMIRFLPVHPPTSSIAVLKQADPGFFQFCLSVIILRRMQAFANEISLAFRNESSSPAFLCECVSLITLACFCVADLLVVAHPALAADPCSPATKADSAASPALSARMSPVESMSTMDGPGLEMSEMKRA